MLRTKVTCEFVAIKIRMNLSAAPFIPFTYSSSQNFDVSSKIQENISNEGNEENHSIPHSVMSPFNPMLLMFPPFSSQSLDLEKNKLSGIFPAFPAVPPPVPLPKFSSFLRLTEEQKVIIRELKENINLPGIMDGLRRAAVIFRTNLLSGFGPDVANQEFDINIRALQCAMNSLKSASLLPANTACSSHVTATSTSVGRFANLYSSTKDDTSNVNLKTSGGPSAHVTTKSHSSSPQRRNVRASPLNSHAIEANEQHSTNLPSVKAPSISSTLKLNIIKYGLPNHHANSHPVIHHHDVDTTQPNTDDNNSEHTAGATDEFDEEHHINGIPFNSNIVHARYQHVDQHHRKRRQVSCPASPHIST